ncbi:terminase [Pseudomonas sp. 1D4]|uniref:Mpo1-like protein n=1 Tax=Pseudomonas sp. 1D4 TaxID=1843691 RepID=UPI00084A6FA4|nr:Mpo1-like protein [Pseudomonas sp. 1D4]OEC42112.1 terminase [Pseudomonas sp. 1D4]
MGKRHPDLHRWQWRTYARNHRNPTNLVLHLIAVPLFIVSVLVILTGLFDLAWLPMALGVIGILASLALQGHGHRLEHEMPEPFEGRRDAVGRILMEQFVTFPRFLFNGGWWRNWRNRS